MRRFSVASIVRKSPTGADGAQTVEIIIIIIIIIMIDIYPTLFAKMRVHVTFSLCDN